MLRVAAIDPDFGERSAGRRGKKLRASLPSGAENCAPPCVRAAHMFDGNAAECAGSPFTQSPTHDQSQQRATLAVPYRNCLCIKRVVRTWKCIVDAKPRQRPIAAVKAADGEHQLAERLKLHGMTRRRYRFIRMTRSEEFLHERNQIPHVEQRQNVFIREHEKHERQLPVCGTLKYGCAKENIIARAWLRSGSGRRAKPRPISRALFISNIPRSLGGTV